MSWVIQERVKDKDDKPVVDHDGCEVWRDLKSQRAIESGVVAEAFIMRQQRPGDFRSVRITGVYPIRFKTVQQLGIWSEMDEAPKMVIKK